MPYVDGFVLPVPRAKLDAYRAMAEAAGKVWMEHGALQYWECVGDDVPDGEVTSFPMAVKLRLTRSPAFPGSSTPHAPSATASMPR